MCLCIVKYAGFSSWESFYWRLPVITVFALQNKILCRISVFFRRLFLPSPQFTNILTLQCDLKREETDEVVDDLTWRMCYYANLYPIDISNAWSTSSLSSSNNKSLTSIRNGVAKGKYIVVVSSMHISSKSTIKVYLNIFPEHSYK